MGSIRFIVDGDTLQIDCVQGRPFHLTKFEKGVDPYDRGLGAIPMSAIPADIEQLFRAMQIARPPTEFVRAAFGVEAPDAMSDAVFGVGSRGAAEIIFLPTSLTANGHRAWVAEKSWVEGGGEGWFGAPAKRSAYVAGIWLNEGAAQQWAEGLAAHPLGSLLMAEREIPHRIITEGDPTTWGGVEIQSEEHELIEGGYLLAKTDAPNGVYRALRIAFGHWSGTVYTHEPQMWEVEVESTFTHPITPRYITLHARNGVREVLLRGNEADMNEDGSRPRACYLRKLPDRKSHAPTNVSGNWATFWPTPEAWERFATEHHIVARRLTNIHALEGAGKEFFIPLDRAWAELAWRSGAQKLPAESVELKAADFIAGPRDRRVESGPLKGATIYHTTVFLSSGCSGFKGWVRCEPGLGISHAQVVREIGDDSRERTETTVFTDGSCVYQKD